MLGCDGQTDTFAMTPYYAQPQHRSGTNN